MPALENPPIVEELLEKLRRLEERIAVQERDLQRLAKVGDDFDALLQKQIDIHTGAFEEAFDRVKHLELHVFPNLSTDIDALRKLIGDGGEADNSLDRRKP